MRTSRVEDEDGLTVGERTVLEMVVVGQRLARAGYGPPPAYHDMQSWMGLKSINSIFKFMDSLAAKGFIRMPAGSSRAVEVLRLPGSSSSVRSHSGKG